MSLKEQDSPNQELRELEDTVLVAHAAVLQSYGCGLQSAMKAGEAIIVIQARKLIRHGQWGEFYRRTCGSKRSAQVYVQLAKARPVLEAKAQSSAPLSIEGALRFLRKQNGTSGTSRTNKTTKPAVVIAISNATDPELTEALTALGFDRFLQVMPAEWRPRLEARAGGQMISRAKVRHPNVRLKNLDKAKLRLVGGTEASPTPH